MSKLATKNSSMIYLIETNIGGNVMTASMKLRMSLLNR